MFIRNRNDNVSKKSKGIKKEVSDAVSMEHKRVKKSMKLGT